MQVNIKVFVGFSLCLVCFFCAFFVKNANAVEDKTKVGDVVLELKTCSELLPVQEFWTKGNDYFLQKDFAQAIKKFDLGLEMLGRSYDFDGLCDDTGQKLVLAKMFEEQGNIEGAATIKGRMLENRMLLFKQKYECQ